jgi:hypothetical protein
MSGCKKRKRKNGKILLQLTTVKVLKAKIPTAVGATT